MNIVSKIKIGIQYMNDWPLEPLLNPVFPECRVKKAVIAGRKILPPFIVFILFWAVYQGGGFKGIPLLFAISSNFPVTLVCVIFLMLMPLQGYLWFYKRAVTKLNDRQKDFYLLVCTKLEKQPVLNPTMMDLEKAINACIKTLGAELMKKL